MAEPATTEAAAPEAAEGKRIKLTSRVRRGLQLAHLLLVDSFDPDAVPSQRQVPSWPQYQQDELNAAMAWLEQNGLDPKPRKRARTP
jgi:hypothetical protein